MPGTVLFESERQSTRADVASCLRTVVDRLAAGSESVTMDPPGTVTPVTAVHTTAATVA